MKFYHNLNQNESILNNVMFMDLQSWIQNDSLVRNDKIFMDNGVEVRVPFLDQEMIEKFLYINDNKKINFFKKNKPYINKLFKKELGYLTKKKQGFDSPFSDWLQTKIFSFDPRPAPRPQGNRQPGDGTVIGDGNRQLCNQFCSLNQCAVLYAAWRCQL